MPELRFRVQAVEPLRHAASPHLVFRLAVDQAAAPAVDIETVLLHAQIRIEPHLRTYDESSRERLYELFGAAEQWSRTLHGMLWTHADVAIPRFSERRLVDLPVPCSYDFNIAATRYFDGVRDGEVPLSLLFSGTIFHRDESGALRVAPISWEEAAAFRFPVQVWKDMMEHYYPRSAWLRVGKDVFDRLREYQRRSGTPSWEVALDRLLDAAQSRTSP
jgi:hypothetical protein